MRGPHSSSPRRRSPPLFRRSRKNPPHWQRRQHPPLEPLRPPPRIPSRIPRPAPRPNQLRILRHSTNPNPPPRPNPLTSSRPVALASSRQALPVAQGFSFTPRAARSLRSARFTGTEGARQHFYSI